MSFKEITFTIHSIPKALKRHREGRTKNGDKIRYDPSESDKESFLWQAKAAHRPNKPLDEALKLKVMFYMPRPKNHYGTGRNKDKLKESAPVFHTVKPDLDNLIKFVKDALNGVYWRDDSCISTVISRKVYTNDSPKTIITIKPDGLNKK